MQEEDLSLIETHVGLLGEYTEVPAPPRVLCALCPVCSALSCPPLPLAAAPLCLPSALFSMVCQYPLVSSSPSPWDQDWVGPQRGRVKDRKALCFPAPSPPTTTINNPPTPTHHLQVPEWTKCSNREKRKEKEKPFYSDSEGESGPTESADSGEMGRAGMLCPRAGWLGAVCVCLTRSCVPGGVHLPVCTCVCVCACARGIAGLFLRVRLGPGQVTGRVCGFSAVSEAGSPGRPAHRERSL